MFKKYSKLQILLLVLYTNLFNNNSLYSMENNINKTLSENEESIEYQNNFYNMNNNNIENQNFENIIDNQFSIDNGNNNSINNDNDINNLNNNINILNISDIQNNEDDEEDKKFDNQDNDAKTRIENEVKKFKVQYINFLNTFNSRYEHIQESRKLFELLLNDITEAKQSMINSAKNNIDEEYLNVNKDVVSNIKVINKNFDEYRNKLNNFNIISQTFNDNFIKNILVINTIKKTIDNDLTNKCKSLLNNFSKYINNQDDNLYERIEISNTLKNLKTQISDIYHAVNQIIAKLQQDSYSLINNIQLMKTNTMKKVHNIDKNKDNNKLFCLDTDIAIIIFNVCHNKFIIDFINSIQEIKHIKYTNEIFSYKYNK